ncbi:Uncharacterized protein FWK35_00026690 [Aphis craccivora]|uniref:Double jelly roll-like domain-containing protein n=1 Tax=Aphis craccivora TaxID=307492 RepID=A0A6G0W394_APHCR|nr:Uncharacterized protein FWK35_00026690 [Aphis craccivora]
MICIHHFKNRTMKKSIDTSKQNDSATASAVDVQLEIEASESLTGVTVYCLLIHDRIVEYVPFTREVRKLVLQYILEKKTWFLHDFV